MSAIIAARRLGKPAMARVESERTVTRLAETQAAMDRIPLRKLQSLVFRPGELGHVRGRPTYWERLVFNRAEAMRRRAP